ncbi:unnamed protein product [Didymodactylos carnosus]|uniref:Kinesin light chain n=1 Tax=Didymodactylos carnosus TaxID=1234261 RepID=A0A815CVH6_9BILA|nr:unnamed protein product [Didymodactylos carnosus]CAF1302826.1 unnamed protein product [Didymodactylos carnosus]CAF4100646.1 unnamed protein product [Didymodactylos carnosus]CAF4109345.1 unnamed protein product [Didymodactylos carnosus]
MGEYSKAFSVLKESLNIHQMSQDNNNSKFAATTYYWLGRIECFMKIIRKHLNTIEKQYKQYKKRALPEKHPDFAITYSNIGDVKRLTGDHTTARSFLEKALEIQENVTCDRCDLAWIYTYMGETYREMKDYSTALELLEKALKIRDKLLASSHPDLAVTCRNLAKVYNGRRQFKVASGLAQLAVEMAEQKLSEKHPHILEYKETVLEIRKSL